MNDNAKKTTATKPPKKLIPRTAAKQEPVVQPEVPAAAPVAANVPAPAPKPVRKPNRIQETVARHQKVLADALVQAQAIRYDQPKVMKPSEGGAKPAKTVKSAKTGKPERVEKSTKAKKTKLVRDSYAMPEAEYNRIGELKKRMAALGREVKKSELLRAEISVLLALDDAELKTVMARVERIKTGRPAK